ncbi:MAG: hypothetical protein ACFB15_01960 [Cyclobacteriaceae bacterium]
MNTKKSADELRQRILKLGQQKLEEEQLYQQMSQAVERLPTKRTSSKVMNIIRTESQITRP